MVAPGYRNIDTSSAVASATSRYPGRDNNNLATAEPIGDYQNCSSYEKDKIMELKIRLRK